MNEKASTASHETIPAAAAKISDAELDAILSRPSEGVAFFAERDETETETIH